MFAVLLLTIRMAQVILAKKLHYLEIFLEPEAVTISIELI